jgi:nucleotide-binding universal stress UspA family protein
MDRVLAAVDGSEASNRSLDTLVSMAKEFSSAPEVVLLTVKVPMPPLTGMGVVVSADMLDTYYAQAQEETIASARAKLDAAGLKYVERKEVGDPSEMIVQVAQETGAKLIFIGSRGMGALGTLVLGSTSNKVIHQTRIPVVITH